MGSAAKIWLEKTQLPVDRDKPDAHEALVDRSCPWSEFELAPHFRYRQKGKCAQRNGHRDRLCQQRLTLFRVHYGKLSIARTFLMSSYHTGLEFTLACEPRKRECGAAARGAKALAAFPRAHVVGRLPHMQHSHRCL